MLKSNEIQKVIDTKYIKKMSVEYTACYLKE